MSPPSKMADQLESFRALLSDLHISTMPENGDTATPSDSNMTTTIYSNATIITMNANRDVIIDGALVVKDDKIFAILQSESVEEILSGSGAAADAMKRCTIIDLKGKIIMPGLINTHSHLGQSLIRGLAEDMDLHEWLCDAVWKFEANFNESDGYVAASLTIAEMLKTGTTCFLESMLTAQVGVSNVVRLVGVSGIRACLGKLIKTMASPKTNLMVDPRCEIKEYGEESDVGESNGGESNGEELEGEKSNGNKSNCEKSNRENSNGKTSKGEKLIWKEPEEEISNEHMSNPEKPDGQQPSDSGSEPILYDMESRHAVNNTPLTPNPPFAIPSRPSPKPKPSKNKSSSSHEKVATGGLEVAPCDEKLAAPETALKQVTRKDEMTLDCMMDAFNEYNGSFNDRVHIWAAATTPRGSPLSCHRQIGKACKTYGFPFTMHCAEAAADLTQFRIAYNHSPMQFCIDANLLHTRTVLAHMVNLHLPVDLPILALSGASVAHCPNSNLKLGSGIASIPEMLKAGVNISLGTDGAPCGNTYDMFREMHLAGILHKGANKDASLVTAMEVLEMATINGAKALGLDDDIGSLEHGKKADFIVINPNGIHCAPYDQDEIANGGLDPVTLVVHTCTGRDVEMVVIDGDVVMRDGRVLHLDEEAILSEAKRCVKDLRSRAGVDWKSGTSFKGNFT